MAQILVAGSWSQKVKLLRDALENPSLGKRSRREIAHSCMLDKDFVFFCFLYVRFKHMQNYRVGFISFAGG